MRPFIGITADYVKDAICLKESYIDAFNKIGFDVCIFPVLTDIDTVINKFNGIVLSGGDDIDPSYYGEEPMYDLTLIEKRRIDFEIALFKACLKINKPVLGICNGMQLMNVALGGTLYQDLEKQLSVEINHRKGYHNINVFENDIVKKGVYRVGTAHHQGIKEEGSDVRVFSKSDDGVVEAISIDGQKFSIGIQWHPERDIDNMVNKMLFHKFQEACIAIQ